MVRLERDPRGVATLTLDRPEVHNALNVEMIRALRGALRDIEGDDAVRVVVLTGAGQSFCAGGDLEWMRAMTTQDRATRIDEATELAEMLAALNQLAKPVIARVNGQAYGGGMGVISCCDVAVGVDSARFGLTEVRLGLIPATISPFVVQRIGEPASRRLMLSGRRFDAVEAERIGLLSRQVPETGLDEAVEAEVVEFLQCAPGAVAACKQLIGVVREHTEAEVREVTPGMLAETWESGEAATGIAAFFEKRTPPWRQD